MGDFSDFWSGKPGESQMAGYTPWIKSPGYDFSSTLYSYLTSMIGQQAPQYRGGGMGAAAAGPSIAPELQALMGLGRRYMNTGMPTVFGTGVSSLGRFLAPSFTNPYARMQQGYPDYFGAAQMGGGGYNPMSGGGMGGGGMPPWMQGGWGAPPQPQPKAQMPPPEYNPQMQLYR